MCDSHTNFQPAPVILRVSLAVSSRPNRGSHLTPADILRVATVSDAQISPTGEWIVYSVSSVEGEQTVTNLWLARVGERLTASAHEPSTRTTPQLGITLRSAQPTLALGMEAAATLAGRRTANRLLSSQLTMVNVEFGSPTPTRAVPRFITAIRETNFFITYAGEPFAWSPDSRMIAYVSASEEETDKDDDPRVIDRIQYKSRTSLSDRLRTHVWMTDVDAPQPRQLTSGLFYDHALSFSPRGDEIAFLSNHETDPDANNNSDIFAVNLQGQIRQITATVRLRVRAGVVT